MNDIIVSPSILSADFAALGRDVADLEREGADWIHADVMDGAFVPNITLGPDVVRAIRPHTSLPLDVHLMIQNPINYLETFAKAGANILTFHIEAMPDPVQGIKLLHDLGIKAGLAISPETSIEAVSPYLDMIDMVLVMTVRPGFGGQKFMPECADKIRTLRRMAKSSALRVQVDGGINFETVKMVLACGADVIVAGSAVFGASNRGLAIAALRRA